MNLAVVLLILVAEAFVLLSIVLLLRLRNRIAPRSVRSFARRARERNNLGADETAMTRLGAGTP
jgi:hypothetical protein